MLSPSTFILLALALVAATWALGNAARRCLPADDPPAPAPPPARWSTFRLHPARLLEGGGPAIEALPDGLQLLPLRRSSGGGERLDLADGRGQKRVTIRERSRRGRASLRVRLDGRALAELRSPRSGPAALAGPAGFTLSGDPAALEFELRRDGKLIASVSPEIAPLEGSAGVEVLASEDPLPALAVAAACGLLARSASRPATVERVERSPP